MYASVPTRTNTTVSHAPSAIDVHGPVGHGAKGRVATTDAPRRMLAYGRLGNRAKRVRCQQAQSAFRNAHP
jgi:hypothetical protein